MRALKQGAVLFVLAMAGSTLAATTATGASNDAADGYATKAKSIGKQRMDVKAQENARMSKCKGMAGDERRGCEANAKSVAQNAMNHVPPADGAGKLKQ